MKKLLLTLFGAALVLVSCAKKESSSPDSSQAAQEASMEPTADAGSYNPERGEGKFDKVDLAATLDQTMAGEGKKVAEVKCTSCHKPTEEKLVGPGWKGVTSRHKPEWIMNFIMNPDPMIDKDPKVKEQLEVCLVRMPNQGLNDTEARSILEYMRQIDGVK